ncbi:response regulator [Streptomyces sp. NPDC059906]|uniref:response regulator n=1 Tax=Streptomyces sp. NPDC059906 TaxID=3346997 RepID=UPI00364AC10E
MTIRVLLADDQTLLRSMFRMLIELSDDMEVVGEAADGTQAVELARTHRPDVVVMDIRMPGLDGLAATEMICADDTLTDTRVLVLTTFEIDEYVARAMRAGASGFFGKDTGADQLVAAIRTVAAGDALLSPRATKALIAQFLAAPKSSGLPPVLDSLTPREREVLTYVAAGLSNDAIAQELVLSPLTVRSHVQRIMNKLSARTRAQLVTIAYQSGLVRPARPA